jgi:hypothetical protein
VDRLRVKNVSSSLTGDIDRSNVVFYINFTLFTPTPRTERHLFLNKQQTLITSIAKLSYSLSPKELEGTLFEVGEGIMLSAVYRMWYDQPVFHEAI